MCELHKEALLGVDSPFVRKKEKRLRCPPTLHLHQIFTKTHGFPCNVSLGTSSFVHEISLETEIKFSKFQNSVILKGFFNCWKSDRERKKIARFLFWFSVL